MAYDKMNANVFRHGREDFATRLPDDSGVFDIPGQRTAFCKDDRSIKVEVHYPGENIRNISPETGLMLSLHNWGGMAFSGTADPKFLAENYDVVAIGVDYFQSGEWVPGEIPYDLGWMQALDALRALYAVMHGLKQRGMPFASDRLFATGGSGGGNVSLMANKLAPHTFAVVVDLCGVKKLSDTVAFGLEKDRLNAAYSPDPKSPRFLRPDDQEMRFLGNPLHLHEMKKYGCGAKIITVHGCDDKDCPFEDAVEYAAHMRNSGLDFEFWPVTEDVIGQNGFASTGHALGDRTKIVDGVAGKYLRPGSAQSVRRKGASDFERGQEISYRTTHGRWVVDYSHGFPVGAFIKQ